MRILLLRWLSIVAALAISPLLFPITPDIAGILLASLMLGLLYLFLRPLLLTLLLPLNILLFGLLTPLADALLIRWTAAWVKPLALSYWQCVIVALLISGAYGLYTRAQEKRLGRI